MLTSAIALALLLTAAAGLSQLLKRPMEVCIPLSFCGSILWLYGFYCAGALWPGLIALCAAIAWMEAAAVGKARSAREPGIRAMTPGAVVYLAICLLFLLFLSGNAVTRHDELRLWAAVPKAMHETGRLQLGKDAVIFPIMQDYPPAFALIGFLFTAFQREFSEGAVYVAYTCMALSFFLPALSRLKWRHWPVLAPAGLLLVLAPCVFTSHFGDGGMFGMTLFIDPMLGILAGYTFFLAGHRPFRDGFSAAEFSVSVAVLCLIKSTGAVFALAAVLVALVLESDCRKRAFLCSVAALAVGYGSWKLLLQFFGVQNPLALNGLSREAVGNVLQGMVSVNMVAYGVPLGFLLSFACVYAVLWGLYFGAFRMQREQKGRAAVVTAAGMLASAGVFVYGYARLYGLTMESFPRYMAALLLCLFTCTLLTALPDICRVALERWLAKWKRPLQIGILWGCLAAAVGFFAVWCRIFPGFSMQLAADEDASRIRQAVAGSLDEGEHARIYLVIAGDSLESSHYHHRIYFDLLSDRMHVASWYTQSRVVEQETSAGSWAAELREGYDYVYLLSVEDGLLPVFAELSQDVPEAYGLYRVVLSENGYGIALQRV